MTSFYYLMGVGEDSLDSSRSFVTSWILPPTFLAILRALVSLYAFTTIFVVLGWQGTHGRADANDAHLSYFTSLTFWGIAFYFLFSAIHTFSYARRGYAPLDHWPRPLKLLHSLLYSTIVTFPFLVTIVFWAILSDGSAFAIEFDAWGNISRHCLNSVFAFLELLLPATNPPPWLHLFFLIAILALYVALVYVTFAAQGFYTYNFLNPATGRGRVAAYCFGTLAALIVLFIVIWLLIWIRRRLTRTGKKIRVETSNMGYGDPEMLETRK